MEPVQVAALVVSLAFTAVGLTMFVRAIVRIVSVVRLGQPTDRTGQLGARIGNALTETLLHTRMLQWTKVGAAHWFIMVGFGLLFATLVNAYGQLFDAHFILPVIGTFWPFEWVTELFAWAMLLAIIPLMTYRATRPSHRVRGEPGRFYGSTMWQGYFVEWVILLVGICILLLRFAEYAMVPYGDHPGNDTLLHFPLTAWAGEWFSGAPESALADFIWMVAAVKIVVSMAWMIVLGSHPTMGVAWHRFSAPFNIAFKRAPVRATALGAVKPLTSGGRPVSLDDLDDLDEHTPLGVGHAEDFSWKGILDFTTCTECGRCQSQCPAWNTEKPLSPKLLITALRDHTYAKAPYLLASESDRDAVLAAGGETLLREVERPLIGDAAAYGVIDPDVLWSCTTCGACVQQCPVDIEHVDHIVDMRRYQLLVEASFPAELNQLFRGLESRGNPWNMTPGARLEWAQGLPFDVPVVGEDVGSLREVEWLFWVGCAGAYEDRAKKTARAVAELLHLAGVSFAVLGTGETCTGDPARRAGNEFVFQALAAQNAETFREHGATKVVATCAHCFNTLRNEYGQFGVDLDVVHHTQLLNRLVREGRLTPIANGAPRRRVTYHDPCYLGRHNQVYTPPRDLLQVLPGAELTEMPRNSERSFCCGAGGARMWMEERIGERINANRTAEAVATGAEQIAVSCPFCRIMLADGLTAQQAAGQARAEVEVLDVAQLLLAAVKEGTAAAEASGTPAAAPAADVAAGATGAGATGAGTAVVAPARPSEPATPPAAPAPSLFDVPAPPAPPTAPTGPPRPATEAPAAGAGSAPAPTSLFDVPAPPAVPPASRPSPATQPPSPPSPPRKPSPTASLFDVPAPATTAPEARPEAPRPTSLFDVPAPAPPTASTPAAAPTPETPPGAQPAPASPEAAPTPVTGHLPRTDIDLTALDSLFDIPAPTPTQPTPAQSAATQPTPTQPASRTAVTEPPRQPQRREPAGPARVDIAPSGRSLSEPPPGHPPRTDVDLSSLGSLFDIAAPAAPTGAAGGPDAVEPASGPTGGRTAASAAPPEEPRTRPGPPADSDPPPQKPPPPPGPPAESDPSAGQTPPRPRTDVDLGALESLFDV